MDWLDYREALGIGFDDNEKVKHFTIKIINILEEIKPEMASQISDQEYFYFCNMTGTSMEHGRLFGEGYRLILTVLKNHCRLFEYFVAYYMAFINCQKDEDYKKYTRQDFINIICDCLKESHISYDLLEDDDCCFLFPKGAKELDDALVSDTLIWLNDYPLTKKAWAKALKDYSESTDLTASDTADNFRKTLERFFQEFFMSDKSLENLKSEYGKYLSSKGIPTELKNNLENLLEAYTRYMNNYAKHHDKTSQNVLEYIMYQTGNLIRLLITLK